MSTREYSYHSYYGAEGADGPVRRRVAELAEIVASDCDPPLEPSYVCALLHALVNSIRGRAATGWSPPAPRESETRAKPCAPKADLDFEASCPEAAPASEPGRRSDMDGPCVIGFEDAQRVLQEIRNERVRGGGPHEDLQRALG